MFFGLVDLLFNVRSLLPIDIVSSSIHRASWLKISPSTFSMDSYLNSSVHLWYLNAEIRPSHKRLKFLPGVLNTAYFSSRTPTKVVFLAICDNTCRSTTLLPKAIHPMSAAH